MKGVGVINKHNNGFTIIELLIVIVIIGILVAITAIAYTGVTKSAKAAATKVDLSNVEKNLSLFHIEHGGVPNNLAEFNSASSWPLEGRMTLENAGAESSPMNTKTKQGNYSVTVYKWSGNPDSQGSMYVRYFDYENDRWEEIEWSSHPTFTQGELRKEVRVEFYDPKTFDTPCRAEFWEECSSSNPNIPN